MTTGHIRLFQTGNFRVDKISGVFYAGLRNHIVRTIGELGKARLRGRPEFVADRQYLIWVMPAQGLTNDSTRATSRWQLPSGLFCGFGPVLHVWRDNDASAICFGHTTGDLVQRSGLVSENDKLVIGGKEFNSRLMVGTGRHRSMEEMVDSIQASGAEIITVAIRRLDLDNLEEKNILDYFDWDQYTILPNTAGCKTAEEAIFTAHLAREVTGSDWIKVEVMPYLDQGFLLPDPVGTFEACKQLVGEGYTVLPYIHADPILARMLEEVGCATVMPLGSAIGSGQGIQTIDEIRLIIEHAGVPVVVDAGLGVPSEAAQAIEAGAEAVLVNTAIAQSADPGLMGEAFKLGVQAGRMAYEAGRIDRKRVGVASSPTEGVAAVPVSGS